MVQGDVRKSAERRGLDPRVCGFESHRPYFDKEIVKVYGPYVGVSHGRSRRSVMIYFDDDRQTSMSWARWQMMGHLGRRLGRNEHVDHINDDPLDDRVENSQILTPAENNRKARLGKPSPLKGIEKGWAHGTPYGWMKKGCRCQVCLAARDLWNGKRRLARSGARGPYGRLSDHGDFLHYKRGCHCDLCRVANTAHVRAARNGGSQDAGPRQIGLCSARSVRVLLDIEI